jgi:plasmid stabilization system protein ParE
MKAATQVWVWKLLPSFMPRVERALANPLAYLLLRKHPQVRRVLTRRFPYRIFYIVRSDALVVFAVLHAARHERYWQVRL